MSAFNICCVCAIIAGVVAGAQFLMRLEFAGAICAFSSAVWAGIAMGIENKRF